MTNRLQVIVREGNALMFKQLRGEKLSAEEETKQQLLRKEKEELLDKVQGSSL